MQERQHQPAHFIKASPDAALDSLALQACHLLVPVQNLPVVTVALQAHMMSQLCCVASIQPAAQFPTHAPSASDYADGHSH